MQNSHEKHKLLPVKTYLKIFVILLGMIFLNIGIAHLPLPNSWITLSLIVVATIQAILVCAFYMELIHEDKFYTFVFGTSILFMILFFVITILELNSRDIFEKAEGIKYMRSVDFNNNFAPAGPEQNHKKQ